MPRLTAPQVWVQQQAARWAQDVTQQLQDASAKVSDLQGALELAHLLYTAGVYHTARAEFCKRRWGWLRFMQHVWMQQFYTKWFNQLRRLKPGTCTGPIFVMYGSAKWGPQRGQAQGPTRGILARMMREPGFVVCLVDEFRTSATHWETGQDTIAVSDARGRILRQLRRISSIHGPPIYIARDINAAINILIAGLLAQRLPHLLRYNERESFNKDVQSRMRPPQRPRPTLAQQAAERAAGRA
jgi:hypothetical protein